MRAASGSGRTMNLAMYYCSLAVMIIMLAACDHVSADDGCDLLHTVRALSEAILLPFVLISWTTLSSTEGPNHPAHCDKDVMSCARRS